MRRIARMVSRLGVLPDGPGFHKLYDQIVDSSILIDAANMAGIFYYGQMLDPFYIASKHGAEEMIHFTNNVQTVGLIFHLLLVQQLGLAKRKHYLTPSHKFLSLHPLGAS